MTKTKTHTRYVCQQCGRVSAGFMGKCPQCGSFNSMVEEIISEDAGGSKTAPRGLSGRSTPRQPGRGTDRGPDR
jgi:DNA repair protein RadA/Sms